MLKKYSVVLDVVKGVRPVIEEIERKDPDLGRQMRRAVTSVALNCSEGMYSRGRNRGARYPLCDGVDARDTVRHRGGGRARVRSGRRAGVAAADRSRDGDAVQARGVRCGGEAGVEAVLAASNYLQASRTRVPTIRRIRPSNSASTAPAYPSACPTSTQAIVSCIEPSAV
jgi:hypothetical protein